MIIGKQKVVTITAKHGNHVDAKVQTFLMSEISAYYIISSTKGQLNWTYIYANIVSVISSFLFVCILVARYVSICELWLFYDVIK